METNIGRACTMAVYSNGRPIASKVLYIGLYPSQDLELIKKRVRSF